MIINTSSTQLHLPQPPQQLQPPRSNNTSPNKCQPYCVAFSMVSGGWGWIDDQENQQSNEWWGWVRQIITIFFLIFCNTITRRWYSPTRGRVVRIIRIERPYCTRPLIGHLGRVFRAGRSAWCAKWEERKVILWFSHVRTTQKWIRTRHTRQIVSIYQITETMWRIFFIWGVINFY